MKSYNSAFELISDDPAEVALMEYKGQLMISIRDIIEKEDLMHGDAADIMLASSTEVGCLLMGQISKFTLEWLFLAEKRLLNYIKESSYV